MKIINKANNKELSSLLFTDKLKCTDAFIYYENNTPYINWKGESKLSDGSLVFCNIPKMSLDIECIESNIETYNDAFYSPVVSKQVFVKNGLSQDEDIIIEIKEREMTKKQIEKELGYKIKIKE